MDEAFVREIDKAADQEDLVIVIMNLLASEGHSAHFVTEYLPKWLEDNLPKSLKKGISYVQLHTCIKEALAQLNPLRDLLCDILNYPTQYDPWYLRDVLYSIVDQCDDDTLSVCDIIFIKAMTTRALEPHLGTQAEKVVDVFFRKVVL